METLTKKLYEALFLVDTALAAADWDGVNKAIETVLEKSNAEIVSIRKWDERKLAYEIDHKGRGTYLLCYFRAEGQEIQQIERQVQLSEQIMRVLILSAEHHTQEKIEGDTPATAAEKNAQKAAEERALREEAKKREAAQADVKEPQAAVQADTEKSEEPAAAQADVKEREAAQADTDEPEPAVQVDTEKSEEPAAAQAEVEEVEAPPEPLTDSEPGQVEPEEESSPAAADAEEQEEKKEPEIE